MSEESTTPQYYTCDTSKMRVYWDTEMTDLKEGHPEQIGLVKSDPSKPGEPVVARLTLPCRVPLNAKFSGPGEKQFQKLKTLCDAAAADSIVVSQIKEFIGTSDESVLVGFCFNDKDLTVLQKWSPELKEYLDGFAVQDVAYALAFQYWKTTGGRSLERIALTLGVKIDKSRLHTAVYDAELAKEVDVKLRGLIALGIPSTSIPLVGKDEEWDDRRFNPVPEAAAPKKSATIDTIESQNVVKEPEEPKKRAYSKTVYGNAKKVEQLSEAQEAFLIAHGTPSNKGGIGDFSLTCKCGMKMVVRVNTKKDIDPRDLFFWGCTGFSPSDSSCKIHFNLDATTGQGDYHELKDAQVADHDKIMEYLSENEDAVAAEFERNVAMKGDIYKKIMQAKASKFA